MKTWYRLTVDLDAAGRPLGASYETHVDDTRVGLTVLPEIWGPFDTPTEVWHHVLDVVPVQGVLFT